MESAERKPRERDACEALQEAQLVWTKFGIAAIVGLAGMVVFLAMRRRPAPVAGGDLSDYSMGGIPVVPWPSQRALPAPPPMPPPPVQAPPAAAGAPTRVRGDVITQTFTLPALGDRRHPAVRVAQATDVPYDIVLRTVGPAGTFAAFSYNTNELDNASAGAFPVGSALVIPADQWQPIRLQPREVLYAKGNVAGVAISVTMTPAVS